MQISSNRIQKTKFLQLKATISSTCYLSNWTKFENPFDSVFADKRFKDLMEFLFYNDGNKPPNEEELNKELPFTKPDFSVSKNQLKVTWIGHSTIVIQDGQVTMMLDPHFSDRSSPVSFAGPQRYRQPPIKIQELPPVDVVLISHDHFDHFDDYTVKWLYANRNPLFLVGLNSKDIFPAKAYIHELDWNDPIQIEVKGRKYKIHFFPVCHWSKRSVTDTNQRLWGGFVITTPEGKTIFYPGDTGYCSVFKEIGEMYKQIDLAFIPIGAYLPRAFLKSQHIDPQEAVMIHKQINSKKSIGVHWGTFPLGKQHYLAPRKDLGLARQKHGVKESEFICMQHGQTLTVIQNLQLPKIHLELE